LHKDHRQKDKFYIDEEKALDRYFKFARTGMEILGKLPSWFENSSIFKRSIAVIIAALLLTYKFCQFHQIVIAPKIRILLNTLSSTVNKSAVYNLVHFDTLLLVATSLVVITGIALLTGRPHRPGAIFGKLKGRSFLTFGIFAFLFSALLLGTPTIISNLLFTYYGEDGLLFKSATLHPAYIREALIVALCFSISFADITVRSGATRWWSYLFFLVPICNVCPLLWWNGLAGLLPSRWWSTVKPLFIAASCLSLGLVLPVAQPIRQGFPVYSAPSQQTLMDNIGYFVQRIPGKPEVFMRSFDPSPAMSRLRRSSNGKWTLINKQHMEYHWDRASLDLKRNRVYICEGTTRTLHVYDYPTFKQLSTHFLPLNAFPIRSFDLFQALDAEHGILVLADKEGFIVTIDVESFEVLNSTYLTGESEIWGVQYDSTSEELIVLQNHNIMALSIFDLNYIRSKSFESAAYDFLIDNDCQRIFISFPKKMSVLALDKNSFSEIAEMEAPATVRKMAIDPSRRFLFLSSIHGVMEIRDADDYHLLRRERIGLWIHWLEVIPEFGEIVITMGDIDSIVWSYLSPSEDANLFDGILYTFEKIFRWYSSHFQPGQARERLIRPVENPLMRKGARVVLVTPNDEAYRRNMQVKTESAAVFRMTIIKDPAAYAQFISQNAHETDLVIFDTQTNDPNNTFAKSASELIQWTEENHPRIEILFRFRGL
jgi:hypothetical protein